MYQIKTRFDDDRNLLVFSLLRDDEDGSPPYIESEFFLPKEKLKEWVS